MGSILFSGRFLSALVDRPLCFFKQQWKKVLRAGARPAYQERKGALMIALAQLLLYNSDRWRSITRSMERSTMSQIFETTFDNTAADYERSRPAYLPAIFDDILRYKPLSADSNVLEIGMGTGAATRPFLETGCRFVGVEPGKNLAMMAADKYREYPNFSVCTQRLQDYVCPKEEYDLIYAATAFHWIPEDYGYKRVFTLLKEGGAFARFRYHAGPDQQRQTMAEEIQTLYREYMQRESPAAFSERDAKAIADTTVKYGFTDTKYYLYHTTKTFTADEYMTLLRTYPDHMRLPDPQRARLFDGIYRAIMRSGGLITVNYTMDLELARKPFRFEGECQ